MIITQALTDRFLQGNCSPEEADAIVDCLLKDKHALDKFVGQQEWDAVPAADNFNETAATQLLHQLKQELFRRQHPESISLSKRYITRFVAAAAVLAAIIVSGWLLNTPGKQQPSLALARSNDTATGLHQTAQSNWQTRINTNKNPLVVKLQDGSIITLYANTVVKYPQPFTGNTREIELSGDAFFEVAKNKLKPFIVHSGNLSTTALGTSFRITAFGQGLEKINVKLFTGKVVIKSTRPLHNWNADVFLLPGQELTYNHQSAFTKVSVFNAAKVQQQTVLPAIPEQQPGNELHFSSTALPEVLEQLSVFYNTTIDYSKVDISRMNFTGSISRLDDIGTILKIITRMNGLQATAAAGGFSISRLTK